MDRALIKKVEVEGERMFLPRADYFDANLPGASQTVRIASFYDAEVFVHPVGDQGQRPGSKGASSRHGKGQQLRGDGQRDPAITTGARLTRIVGYDKSVTQRPPMISIAPSASSLMGP